MRNLAIACLAWIAVGRRVGVTRRVQSSFERLQNALGIRNLDVEESNDKHPISAASLAEIRHATQPQPPDSESLLFKTLALLFFAAFSTFAAAFYWKRPGKEARTDWDSKESDHLPAQEGGTDDVKRVSSTLTKVVASLSSGETFAEVVICVNSTVDDLAAAILKKTGMKANTHVVTITYMESELSGKQVLKDIGFKPLLHSMVTVTVCQRTTLKISFQPIDAPVTVGYLIDAGEKFKDHGSASYGWSHDTIAGGRKRNKHRDLVLDTFIIPDKDKKHGKKFHWKIALEPGAYEVKLGFSDPHPLWGRKDGNAGRLNGCPFDVGKGCPHKELTMDVVLPGKELRLEGSYAAGMSALSYIHICGGSLPADESLIISEPTSTRSMCSIATTNKQTSARSTCSK